MRVGNFTSSSIWMLMTNGRVKGEIGKPAQTYIKHKNRELLLGRNLQKERSSREYNNRWYTEVKAWKFEVISEGKQPSKPENDKTFIENDNSDNAPF